MTEAADGSVESIDGLSSKMQEEFSQIGVSITDANGQIRSTYDILTDIGAQWPNLTQNQKAYYAELAAGKNQANIFIALMDNIGTAVAATATAYDSAGSAAEENAKRMDSVEGKLEQFRAAWEKLSTSFMSSDFLKNIIEFGTNVIKFLSTPLGKASAEILAFAGVMSVLSSKASVFGKLSEGVGKFATSLGSVGKASGALTKLSSGLSLASSLAGPVALGITAIVAAIVAVGAASENSRKKARDFYDGLSENAQKSASELEAVTSQVNTTGSEIETLKSKISELQAKGAENGGLSLVDQQELDDSIKKLQELNTQIDFLKQKQAVKAEAASQGYRSELEGVTKLGFGLGQLTQNEGNLVEHVSSLTGALTRNRAEYQALVDSGKENTFQGKQLAKVIENQETQFNALLPTLEEAYDGLMNGSEADKEYAKSLEPLILAANRATNGTTEFAQSVANLRRDFHDVNIETKDGTKNIGDLGEEMQQLSAMAATGAISNQEYYKTLQEGIDSLDTTKVQDAYKAQSEGFQNMSESERREMEGLIAAHESYGAGMTDLYNQMTQEGFEYTQENIDQYQQVAEAAIEWYANQAGMWQDANGNWQGGTEEARAYVSQLIDATSAMDGLGQVHDFIASQADAAWQSMVDSSVEATAEAQASLEEFNAGFVDSMNQLKSENETAFNQMVDIIAQTTGRSRESLLDSNGQIRSDLNLTAEEASKIGPAIENGLSGFGAKIQAQVQAAQQGFDGLVQAASSKAQEASNKIEEGLRQGAERGSKSAADAWEKTEFKDPKPEVTAQLNSSAWDTWEPGSKEATVYVKKVGPGANLAKGTDYVRESGFYTVGETGRETVFLPRGAAVATASETRNMRGMLKSGRSSSGGISIDNEMSDSFKKIANSLVKVTKTLTGVSLSATNQQAPAPTVQSRSVGMARAASYDDPHKKNFDAAYDELKYLQDMDRISEADYLNRLENLNNSYFGGRMEYLEEYRKYEVEVYKGRKKLQEQAERDREKAEKDRIQSVKDNFKKEEDALEYMRDKDLITEEEYYRQLAALNDKYYKGKTEFLDEYQKYEIKVYDYLKKKEEERLKELKEQTEKQYENTRDYIVDMIDEQIDAEDAKLDALDKEKEEQEKLQKIEEARKKLAEAQNQKVMVYRAGQGFVYESDAAAIEEANKELNDLLEEEKFDKQKEEIQAEIDRLEELKKAWEDSLDINEDLEKYGVLMDWIKAYEEANYEDRLNMAEKFGEEYRRILKEIEDAQAHVSDTASSQLPNFKPNGYARGTNYVQQNEKALVGENGPELVNLPKGSGVLTSDETKNMRLWGSISPADMFSSIWKLLSDAPRFTFDTPNTAPSFDFSAWNVGVDFDSGLADAIKNNLQDTVIQYLSKRDR